jgi:hypothetical protein
MRTLQNTLDTKVEQIIYSHIGPIDFDIYDDDQYGDFISGINLDDYTKSELTVLFTFNWVVQAKATDLSIKEVYIEREQL